MLLNNEGKKEFIKSNFHQYFDITLTGSIEADNVVFGNFVLSLENIDKYYSLNDISKFFNDNYNNVIFSSRNNEHIYRYEFYQGVYFIRIEPFSKFIRMHIIPKKYDASNTLTNPVLLFKDRDYEIDEENYIHQDVYTRNPNGNPINICYTGDTIVPSRCIYQFDIRDKTRNLHALQINMGYRYPSNCSHDNGVIKHYTGIMDESDEHGKASELLTTFNDTCVDVNDNPMSELVILEKGSRQILTWDDNPVYNVYHDDTEVSNEHHMNTLYHKTLKYLNDDLYMEENNKTLFREWEEINQWGRTW